MCPIDPLNSQVTFLLHEFFFSYYQITASSSSNSSISHCIRIYNCFPTKAFHYSLRDSPFIFHTTWLSPFPLTQFSAYTALARYSNRSAPCPTQCKLFHPLFYLSPPNYSLRTIYDRRAKCDARNLICNILIVRLHTVTELGVSSCINKEISSDATVAIRLGNDPCRLRWHMFCCFVGLRYTWPAVTTLSFGWSRQKAIFLEAELGGWIRRIREM